MKILVDCLPYDREYCMIGASGKCEDAYNTDACPRYRKQEAFFMMSVCNECRYLKEAKNER